MYKRKPTVHLPMTFMHEDYENIVATALECGIDYWACLDNTTEIWEMYRKKYPKESCSIVATRILLAGHSLNFTDAEKGTPFKDFFLNDLREGIMLFTEAGNSWFRALEDLDAESADVIFQYGMFGELIYS